jgi:hypothetical protein
MLQMVSSSHKAFIGIINGKQKIVEGYKGLWLFFRATEDDSCCKMAVAT